LSAAVTPLSSDWRKRHERTTLQSKPFPRFFSIVHIQRQRFSQLSKPSRRDKAVKCGAEIADLIRHINRAVGFFLAARHSSLSPLASAKRPMNFN
jgi:hypothetical protein